MKPVIAISAAVLWLVRGAIPAYSLNVGDTATDFSLSTTEDSVVSLARYQGEVRVLFFFGCG